MEAADGTMHNIHKTNKQVSNVEQTTFRSQVFHRLYLPLEITKRKKERSDKEKDSPRRKLSKEQMT